MPHGRQEVIVLVVTRDGRAIEYPRKEFLIRFGDYGITVTPKKDRPCGWVQRVHPWANVGTVEERKES